MDDGGDRGGGLLSSWRRSFSLSRGFNSAMNRLMFSFNFASDLLRFRRDFRHDRATIKSRSSVNCGVRASPIACRSMGNQSAPIPRHLRLNRGSIAPRSRLDRATIAEFFHASSGPSDEDRSLMKIRRAKAFHVPSTEAVRSRSRDLHLVKIGRSRRVHVAKGETCDHFT